MTQIDPIKFIDRETSQVKVERVYGQEFLNWLYNSKSGNALSDYICRKPLSALYGVMQDSVFSKRKVKQFIKDFEIQMSDYLPGESAVPGKAPYKSFNEFFIRRFRPGARQFPQEAHVMGAVAEARYLGYREIRPEQTFPLKGESLSPQAILRDSERAKIFRGGPLLIARLCPVDYHRYHYPDDGRVERLYRVPGRLHSVNPMALKFKQDTFASNERVVSILETKNFGKIAYIEVGAICVGRMVQSHDISQSFQRGQEKGYFLFGGSTVVLMGEKGAWYPSIDILENSHNKIETFIKLGSPIAQANIKAQ